MAAINPTDIQNMSLDELKQAAQNGNIAATGKYGEGGAYGYRDLLAGLKAGVQAGQLSILDYQKLAQPISKKLNTSINSLVSQGRGDIATGLSEDLRSNGFFKPDASGKNTFNLPFSQQEYAALPTNVLPTQEDVDKGFISRDALPFQRYQNPTGGGTDAQGNAIPSDINLGSDRGQVELEAQRQADELQKTLDQQKTLRDTNRTALADQLAKYQQQQFDRAIPQLTEQANTSGILRSTGFGEKLADKYSQLTQDTENQLAMQGLSDSEKYASGLGDIANTRTGLQTAGLQRDFSLDDTARSTSLAQQLAELSKPSGSSGKTNGEKWAEGVQTAAQVGNTAAKFAAL